VHDRQRLTSRRSTPRFERVALDYSMVSKSPIVTHWSLGRSPMYGNLGLDHDEIVDQYLAKLPAAAKVLNLGCGPNINGTLTALARTLGRYQFNSTLILADRESCINSVEKSYIVGPRRVQFQALNAAESTTVLGWNRIDLVLAFGLFGVLDGSTTPDGGGEQAWPAVLREIHGLLKNYGVLIICNSCDRQPFEEFLPVVLATGLSVIGFDRATATIGAIEPGEERYLLVCAKFPEKRKRSIAPVPSRRRE